ncbi:TetR/AcrR family transcriptional regulator [Paenibacillus agricola]|uniref:TetR/AcrR family transcriptional regulator n=1 Tax=Paenibacillus agricola TaxID=2716264 RepID=A0ABX0JDM5_9BACL|nr:TetR/AcrR family transcriptional regulator [Paenibacillus agricola]NHN31800.1 TetR/AcrR family transcriptional regulator [Paenibacillus agricola]
MTINQLHDIALKQFALRGYEGATLETIAREVGIKKQSIYGHFKNKEQFFLHVFKSSVNTEIEFLDQLFQAQAELALEDMLLHLIRQYKDRYADIPTLRLIMYAGFIFPPQLEKPIGSMIAAYISHKRTAVYHLFSRPDHPAMRVDARQATEAYMNLLEGMLVELIYGGTSRFDGRLEASWDIFWYGIQIQAVQPSRHAERKQVD